MAEMATDVDVARGQHKRRGRPRRHAPPAGLVRRNLLVDSDALGRLCRLYGMTSESEAVRRAVDLALLVDEGERLADSLAERGGPVDVYRRTAGASRLPVHLRPEDVVDEDREPYADPAG